MELNFVTRGLAEAAGLKPIGVWVIEEDYNPCVLTGEVALTHPETGEIVFDKGIKKRLIEDIKVGYPVAILGTWDPCGSPFCTGSYCYQYMESIVRDYILRK